MIKYSWARYKDKPVHISDVSIEMREVDHFYNLVTDKRMTAYLHGSVKPHFHHVDASPHDNETYLHQAAKEVFANTYNNCLQMPNPFYLEFWSAAQCKNHFNRTHIVCPQEDILRGFDLTKKFRMVEIEKHYNEFKPDIQLQCIEEGIINEVIFIEIVVTHESSLKKIHAGKRMIEIKIRNEEDILSLRKKSISVNDKGITFYNFKKNTETVDHCSQYDKGCNKYHEAFVLYKNGSYQFLRQRLENIISVVESEESRIARVDYFPFESAYQYARRSDNDKDYLYLSKIMDTTKVKDCRFCRYKADRIGKGKDLDLFCKFLKKDIQHDTAWECEYFRV